MTFYAKIENNEIARVNIQLPAVVDGTSIPAGATELEHLGLYPIVGDEPAYDTTTQRLAGPVYSFDGAQVVRTYTVEDIPTEELAEKAREEAKRKRSEDVANIKVTTAAGHTFDGDEESQTRMSRAIIGMTSSQQEPGVDATLPWVLADNTMIQVDATELTEALTLAGRRQAELWLI